MKNQILFLSLVTTALLAGCAKNETDTPDTEAPATHITAMAQGAGDIELGTKAPVTGTSLDGQTAEVYASTYDISSYTGSLLTTFSNVYARGTMTFDDNNYVDFDTADFGGLNGGNSLLPQDGTAVYLYGFYPKGWVRTISVPGGSGSENEALTYLFDGKTDVMSTWITPADNMTIKYNDVANMPDKADFTFKHLLTRYNIRIKANDADAISAWGHVKSIQIKEADPTKPVNLVWYDKSTIMNGMSSGYLPHETNTTPTAFYKLTGADLTKPTYSNDKFEAADYAASQSLTTTETNACYTMVAPVEVRDADPLTPELTLEVVTIDAANKQKTVEIPVSLLQNKFPEVDGSHSTRGYSITLTLNFRVGIIQAIATVEEWKEYGNQNIDVDMPTPAGPKIGDVKNGGVVYWVDPANNKYYKIVSTDETSLVSCTNGFMALSEPDVQNADNGRAVYEALKTKLAVGEDFTTVFPASGWCADKQNNWYLPAKNELLEVYTVWSTNSTFKAAMATHGTQFTTTEYASTTWEDMAGPYVNVVDFASGTITPKDAADTYPLRCIRSTMPAPPKIGDVKDGGIVYEVNGSKYKVFSLTEGSGLWWAAQNTYVLGAAGQDATDGKKNVAAIKAYSTGHTTDSDNTTKTTGVFATDFPAAAFCEAMNTGGVTGWYLPAKDEASALRTAYNANKTVLDKAITDNSGTAMYVVGKLWSSTEHSDTSLAHNESYGQPKGGSCNVRCIKSN